MTKKYLKKYLKFRVHPAQERFLSSIDRRLVCNVQIHRSSKRFLITLFVFVRHHSLFHRIMMRQTLVVQHEVRQVVNQLYMMLVETLDLVTDVKVVGTF